MKRKGFLIHWLWTVFFLLSTAVAEGGEYYRFYNGIRGLGMGGTQINTVNDETALLVNPAALGKLRDYTFTVVDPEVEGNLLMTQTMSETHGTNALMDPQELLSALQNHADKHYHSKAQLFPSLVLPNFGVGVFGIERHDAQLDSATSNMHYDFNRDVGVALGYNFRFWDGRIKIGATARLFDRSEASTDIPSSTTSLTYDSMVNEGGALAVDGGLILSAPIDYLPSISAVVHDIGNTEFSVGSGGVFFSAADAPQNVRQSVDVGAAIFPILTNRIRMSLGGEYRDILTTDTAEQAATYRRIHVGTEINFDDSFFIRAGYNQRYWTAGLEFASRFFQIQLASYGEDIGAAGSSVEDRRYVFKFAFRY